MIKLVKSVISIIKVTVLLLLLGCVVVFMIDNRQEVTVSFYPLPFELQTKVFLVMIFCFLLGLFCSTLSFSKSWILSKIKQFKDMRTIRKLRQELNQSTLEKNKTTSHEKN